MVCFRLSTGETLLSHCKKNKFCYLAILNRIETGMTVDQAIRDYIPHKGSKANNARYFYKRKSLHAYYGGLTNDYQICLKHIRNGMTVKEAVKKTAERKRRKRNG